MGNGNHIYKVTSGNTVTVVQAPNVTAAAASLGTTPTETTIRRVDSGCYSPTLSAAKKKYEKDPVSSIPRKPTIKTRPAGDKPTIKTRPADDKPTIKTEPIPVQPKTITKYQFTLDNGKVKTFEAINQDDADHIVKKWNADLNTLRIIDERQLSQHEINEALRGAASRSGMDYARTLIRYEQVKGIVPVRDGGTGKAILVSEQDWNALPKEYRDIVTSKGLEGLNNAILKELPISYREIADKSGLEIAIAQYNADVERSNIIVHKLKPYKDGDNYDIVTPLQLGIVTADDLKAAGFDTKDVAGVDKYVNKLSGQIAKWDKYIDSLKAAIDKHGDKGPQKAALEISKAKQGILTQAGLHDFLNAITESGAIKKYKLGGALAEIESLPQLGQLAAKWTTDITLEDKYNIAETYATYPAPDKLLAAAYRGLVAEAPNMPTATRVFKQFTLGGAAATLKPFVKEQVKDSLGIILAPYKEKGGYNLKAFLADNPEDAPLLLRDSGVTVKNIEDAQRGSNVIVKLKGATKKDWAVAGLILTTVGAGGASFLVAQPAKSALIAASGLSQLGLGGIATVDTVRYWRQMDNTQRGIAIAFDILLLTSGSLATRGGIIGWKYNIGSMKLRNWIRYQYRSARNIIKKILPKSKEADWLLRDMDLAIRTGDVKLLAAAAKRLELQAAKLPKQLAEPLTAKAKALQAASDDWIQVGKKPPTKEVLDGIKANEEFIRTAERALRRAKGKDRYNAIRKVMSEAMRQNEKLKTRVATKEAVKAMPTEKVKWRTGQDVPAKTGKTTALTKYVPKKKAAVPDAITAGAKKKPIPVEDLRKLKPSQVAQRHGVSIWDLSRAIRKLPKGVQEEIALISAEWEIVVTTSGATITSTKTLLRSRLQNLQEIKPATVPFPATQPLPQPQLKPAQKLRQAKKLQTKTQLAIYPFFDMPLKVKTRYKRRRRTIRGTDTPEERLKTALSKDPAGVQTWKQGLIYITVFPPYRTTGKIKDVIYSRTKPHYAETSTGRRSPQRTAKAVGGTVPRVITLPMGIVKATVKGGDVLTFSRGGNGRRGKRRRGRLVY